MNSIHESWTGTRLTPLPHESTLSALWRFGLQNGLRGAALAKTCYNRPALQKKSVNLESDLSHFTKATNWELPSSCELYCLAFAAKTVGKWLHQSLRFCPVCLEAGYHSIWHQFVLLHVCPLHGCSLTQLCQSCGTDTGVHGHRSRLALSPYKCLECLRPLAGVKQSVTAHLEFRVHAQQIDDAFAALHRWVLDEKQCLAPLQNIVEQRSWMITNKSMRWCNTDALVRATALKLQPLEISRSSTDAAVCLLRWQVAMQTCNRAPGYGRLSRNRRVQTPSAVYRATVRIFQRWLFNTSSAREKEAKLWGMWIQAQEEGTINLMAWNPYELAYVLLRNSQAPVPDMGTDVSVLAIADVPAVGLATYENRAPRIAYRAAYLAIYAGYYHLITRARRSGTLSVESLRRLSPANIVAVFNLSRDLTSFISGGVFFPSVPGMPIRPFSPS